MRIIMIPTPSFGRAILKNAQASVKTTQNAAVETVLGRAGVPICLVEESAFWKTAALMMSKTCFAEQ